MACLAPLLPVEAWPGFIRRALDGNHGGLRRAAAALLDTSEDPDAGLVRDCLRAAVDANDMYSACDLLDCVYRTNMREALPEVERAYHEATYSWGARRRAVQAMHVLAPSRFREHHARECLWDCEEEIVEFGCLAADLDDLDVRPRLEFLRDAFAPGPGDERRSPIHRLACERLGI